MNDLPNNATPEIDPRLWDLASRACDGTLSDDDQRRLDAMLDADEAARRCYGVYMLMHADLVWRFRGVEAAEGDAAPGFDACLSEEVLGDRWTSPQSASEPSAMPIVLDAPPAAPSSWFALNSMVGRLVFSYGVSAVVLGVCLLIGWGWKISHDRQIIEIAAGSRPTPVPIDTQLPSIGRVSGMVDCCWSDPRTEPVQDALVSVGQRFSLASGFLEITYDAGAKVILEGPCVYEAESSRGGFLSLGKLTAKVQKQGLGIRDWGLASNAAVSRHSNPQSVIPNPLFAVRTPTAVVTDLGTEFGVEVLKDRRNSVRVYQGRVAIASAKIERRESGGMVLRAGQSAALDTAGALTFVTMPGPHGQPSRARIVATDFVREMPKPPEANGRIDLLDVVAGGNGLGKRRDLGIDPATGEVVRSFQPEVYRIGPGYHRVPWNPLIDGVFVPASAAGPIQLDSAGHVFDGLACSVGRGYSSIWAEKTIGGFRTLDRRPRKTLGDDRLLSADAGMLRMHANMGITFDLAAIRKACPDVVRLVRFHSVARLMFNEGVVDFWVFVDGAPRWNRRWCAAWVDPAVIDVPLRSEDRFLTLVVADCDGNISWDYTAFLAPMLDVVMKQDKTLKQKQ